MANPDSIKSRLECLSSDLETVAVIAGEIAATMSGNLVAQSTLHVAERECQRIQLAMGVLAVQLSDVERPERLSAADIVWGQIQDAEEKLQRTLDEFPHDRRNEPAVTVKMLQARDALQAAIANLENVGQN